jgi:ABC-2 type transport system permease protein
MLFIGPMVLLMLIFLLLRISDEGKKSVKAIVTDPAYILVNRQMIKGESNISYDIRDVSFEHTEFLSNPNLAAYDVWIEINQKVLSNKVVKVFYREEIGVEAKIAMQLEVERRLEEAFIENKYLDVTLEEFRNIKQPLNFDYIDIQDPGKKTSKIEGFVGLGFGGVIVLFVLLFGLAIVRSTAKDKSNRIVEIMLASASSRALMFGKIIGIGFAALVQFSTWVILVGFGLYIMRETLYPDLLDPSNWAQSSEEVKVQLSQQLSNQTQNKLLDVLYNQIDYTIMLSNFVILFVLGYLFYGAFFSFIGAMSNSESDGQQFTLPLIGVLFFSLGVGYITVLKPENEWVDIFAWVPFTSPVVQLVRIGQGYYVGHSSISYTISLLVLLVSTGLFLYLASRLYQANILNFNTSRFLNKKNNNQKVTFYLDRYFYYGFGINIVSWVYALTTDNYELIFIGSIGCIVGAYFCFLSRNWILVFLCLIDAYLILNYHFDMVEIDKEYRKVKIENSIKDP